ncbi:glycosyltransferase [Falsirhodobacter deserti]|uniref:glycosyltransferase n=1 Tax=Falsirhodobacter deserti TaxID=1365611 RepID=UPI000FE41894|nr:glycosyltransferase [Falsirhodobacter deserti]
MKILLVHQNFPGQFLHLAPALAARGHEVQALTDAKNPRTAPVPVTRYAFNPATVDPAAGRLGRNYTMHSDRGVIVGRTARKMRAQGYVPDVIFGHSGWGETLFLKEVWPEARLIVYAEFYYRGIGQDVGFDPEFGPLTFDKVMIAQGRSTHLGQALLHADAGVSPTHWQADTHPPALRRMIEVIHDGVDTAALAPDPQAAVTLPDGRVLRAGDEVLTLVNRNLEPYRGYHTFMRALPDIMAARPDAQVVIVGGDGVSYGQAPTSGKWKDVFLDEVRDRLDLSRLHFLGNVDYGTFRSLMQVTRVHAYLTYPFVLSWSMLEAMSAGALVVGSNTAPVREVIRHGENGLLVDFFDIPGWARVLTEALAQPDRFKPLRAAARATVVDRYDLHTVCLPRMISLVEG